MVGIGGADSPGLFDGLATFGGMGEDALNNLDGGLAGDLIDDSVTSAAATAAATATTSSTTTTTTTTTNTAGRTATLSPSSAGTTTAALLGGPSPTYPNSLSASPSLVNDGSQSSFFNQDISPWSFQGTPPYDSTSPFDTISNNSWELPVHLNLNPNLNPSLHPGQQPLYAQSARAQSQSQSHQSHSHSHSHSPLTGLDPGLYDTAAGAVPVPPLLSPNGQHLVRTNITPNLRNTLTIAQQERLKDIAMPPHLQYHSPQSAGSPDSSASGHQNGAGSSPDVADPSKLASRKRKSSAEVDDDDDEEDMDGHPIKKTAHNMIEKRYRTNLNDKIAALRDSVPALRIMTKSARGEDTTEDREELHGLTPAHKLNKATVLSKATEYIRHLEKRNNRLTEENSSMQARIAAFEKLFMAGAMTGQLPNPLQQPPTPIQYPHDVAAYINSPMHTPRGPDPPGMIPIPDDMKRILASQQINASQPYPVPPAQQFGQHSATVRRQQIQQQQQQQAQMQAGRWSPYAGRLMVGSLAGLMLVEAFVEREQDIDTTEGRGLFGLPISLLSSFVHSTHFSIGGYHISAADMIAKLRLVFLVATFLWLVLPSWLSTSARGDEENLKQSSSVVAAVPSLASPIHVRRQAWLTAIQTVWVPRHNFILEAAALVLKTMKYALRNVFGLRTYLMLTGLSEEEEAARVKAWAIALDAQLAGGDVEINRSRLTLTLLALGTLPNTPLRLMMAALHIRVLLWQVGGALWMGNVFAAKLARSKWNEARQINLINKSLHDDDSSENEPLPEHLALLLEQDCDEVLNDDIIQRAHNLAWNQPTTHNVMDEIDSMNKVVDDHAVRSPMDAVAAWYSSLLLHRFLVNSLSKSEDNTSDAAKSTPDDISLAIDIAPIGSVVQARALVARAVHIVEKRGNSIATAMKALGSTFSSSSKQEGQVKAEPKLFEPQLSSTLHDPDAEMALDCAKAMALLERFAEPSEGAFDIIDSILPSSDPRGMSLLGCTAAFSLMETAHKHPVAREACSASLERMAGTLRIWIGSSAGEKAGLGGALRQKMVDRCLDITKSLVGMETDPGYGSMDDCDDEDGGGC
ncbi:hypothetical protein B0T19DRAFT_95417 [Cercophora scortea]|uniref:BHLH domain-containing protein n=1 Tax=Cercophora scortea TaxID=314031 RepID=A0AAE0IWA9_9PEZI|nr:hypothetical protein B0T19DRAFT_95417 [Cercophora scortea]